MKRNWLRLVVAVVMTFTTGIAGTVNAQGWPEKYDGVMLQGFYWDSYVDTQWSNIEKQADELSQYFSLLWVPNSGNCGTDGNVMGYLPVYWYNHNSCFGTEAQLRSMIRTLKSKGTGVIEDVVINHRSGLNSWMTFPVEANGGKTWQLTYADVCSTDEVNRDKSAGDEYGKATGAADTGDDFNGGRDLDHTSANVQANVINYLQYLKDDLGYAGYRYDMVKGYKPEYTGLYNAATTPTFSVGEYWDSDVNIMAWIDGTAVGGVRQSAAFDFPMKTKVTTCCNVGRSFGNNLYSALMLAHKADYRRYAVTFVENHDTGAEQNGGNGPLTANIPAANAFMLASPGTPCVYLTHWKNYKQEIKQMITARKLAGITNTSDYTELERSKAAADGVAGSSYYAFQTEKLVCVIGADKYTPSADYTLIISGQNYRYYLAKSTETPWISMAEGKYDDPFSVTLTAVSADATAKLVYTTDGSEPTAASTQVESGAKIDIEESTVLKVGLLVGGVVRSVVTRAYELSGFEPHTATVYIRTDMPAAFEDGYVNFWVWDSNGKCLTKNTQWPGDKVTETVTKGGYTWYAQTYDITSSKHYISIVASTKTGDPQTVDQTMITDDIYLVVSEQKNGDKYVFADVSDDMKDMRYAGGDISMLPEYEAHNSGYLDGDGKKIDNLLVWLKDECGWNTFRVRLFVNPNNSDHSGIVQDLEYVKKLGKRIKDAGGKFMLDFHYSDTWADPTKQTLPSAWSSCTTVEQKAEKLYDYTKECLNELIAAGATPDMVQVGNEITSGIVGVWRSSNAAGFKQIVERGCDAVREVCPKAKIILHIERPQNTSNVVAFYKAIDDSKYDVIGLSYYPIWHGSLSQLSTTLNSLSQNFPQKKVQLVETAYNFQHWPTSGVTYDTRSTWPCSPDGQYAFVKDLLAEVEKHDNVNGVSYWFPEEAGNGDDTDWNKQKYGTVIASWLSRGLWYEDQTQTGHWPVKAADGMVHYLLGAYATGGGTEGLRGDANGDGIVSVTDIVATANHILGATPSGFDIKNADSNLDGIISVTDIVYDAQYILNGKFPD